MDLVTTPPGDTTADPRWQPVRVVARLTTPVINLDSHPMHLDGPASWGAYLAYIAEHGHDALPPLSDDAVDFALPLATWNMHGTWGWACSRAHYTPVGYTTVAMRRRPAVDEMARYAPDRRHHLAAGPMKARDTPLPATLVSEITWYALADPEPLAELLDRVLSVGRLGRHGHGRARRWEGHPHDDREASRDRDFPPPRCPRPSSAGAPGTRAPTPSRWPNSWIESSRSAGSDGTGTAASYAGRFTRTTTGRRGETGSSRAPAASRSRSAPPTTTPSG